MSATGAQAAAVIEEITITAERRSESVQDVPLAVTAMSGDFILRTQLDDVKDLVTFTPGITGDSKDSFIDTISIRGILTNDFGVGGDPSVGVFKNDLYQGRNGAVVTSLYDMDRAEVLRGPQGFLFGRNSIAGAISVFTKRPTFDNYNGYADFDVGQRGHLVAEGALNIPVNDNLAFRVAGYHEQEDGYSENKFDPSRNDLVAPNKYAGRLSGRYQNGGTDINLMVEYENRKQSGSIYRATEKGVSWEALQAAFPGLTIGGSNRDVDEDMGLNQEDNGKVLSIGLEAEFDLGFAALTSQTGYKDHTYNYAEDFDATPLAINDYAQNQKGKYFEQELRLVSEGDSKLSWYGGVSYYKEEINVLFTQHASEDVMCIYYYGEACSDYFPGFTPYPTGLLEQNRVKGTYQGWAGYVDFAYDITDQVQVKLGGRYTYDGKYFRLNAFPVGSELGPFFAMGFTTDGYLNETKHWGAFTPRLLFEYHPTDDWMLFTSATRGYKAGGFGSFSVSPPVPFGVSIGITNADAGPDSFDPEEVWSYEIGAKGDLFDGRMSLALNTYYYDYKDLQVTVALQGASIIVDNVGQVHGWGLESTLQYAITDNIELLLNGAYADSDVKDADAICEDPVPGSCNGQPLPQVPKYSASTVVDLHFPAGPGEITFSTEAYYQSTTYGSLDQLNDSKNHSWQTVTLRGGYRANQGWTVIAYVENLMNETSYDGVGQGNDAILTAHYFGPSRPRTAGVRMTWDF
jgi:iron complex outermembrane receptor protein